MSEKLTIEVDFAVTEAVKHVIALLEAFDKIVSSAHAVDTSIDKATDSVKELGKAADATEAKLDETGKTGEDAAKKIEKAGDAADKAGKKAKEGGEEGARGMRKLKDEAAAAEAETARLTSAAVSMVTSFIGLQTVVSLVKELTENLKRAIEARRELGETRLTFDQNIQEIVDNLPGVSPDERGRERARNFVTKFVRDTGATASQSKEILSAAQGTGFPVIDPNKPATSDGSASGYGIAAELAKFAARTRIDPRTSGEFFKLASSAGVKTVADMQKLIAQFEQAGKDTAINSPAQFVAAAVGSSAGRIAQGVPVEQALATVAAAARNQPKAEEAATNVGRFTRTAVGISDDNIVALAKLAQGQRRLSPADVAAAAKTLPPSEKRIELQESIDKNRREVGDTEAKMRLEEEKVQEDVALKEAEAENEKKRRINYADPAASERRRLDLERRQTEIRRMREDLDERRRQNKQSIDDRKQAITDATRKLDADNQNAALTAAYRKLDLKTKENVLRDALVGKSPEEQQRIIASVAQGDIAQEILTLVNPSANQAYQDVIRGSAKPDVRAYQKRNEAYRSNAISQRARATNEAEAGLINAAPEGQEYANNVNLLAEAAMKTEAAAGRGSTGLFSGLAGGYTSESERRAVATMSIVQRQFVGFVNTMTPAQRQKYQGEIRAIDREIQLYKENLAYEGFGGVVEGNALANAQEAARLLGVLVRKVQQEAIDLGAPIPEGFEGKAFPPATPPASGPQSSISSPTDVSPLAIGIGGNYGQVGSPSITYITQHVGNLWTSGGGEFDLPGREGIG